jgi:hypothetical protein
MNSEIKEVVDIATRQLLIGLAWWSASSIALYISLGTSGSSVIWYGGCIAAAFCWYQFGRILLISKHVIFNFFKGFRAAILLGVAAVVGSTASYIGPEALRVMEPSVGTCWVEIESDSYSPIACWSDEASFKTLALAKTGSQCPSSTDYFFTVNNGLGVHCLKVV